MKQNTRLRKFFSVARRSGAGFTLVELIVVIAILAILAGIAVPAYNGYIAKAHKAADDTLIEAINKAAATAVLVAKGVDMDEVYTLYEDKPNNGGALISNAVKGKSGITVEERFTQDGKVKEAFDVYFADNEEKCLQWYGSLKFDGEKFVGVESILTGALKGPDGVANAYQNSSFAHEDFGVPGMTGMVDTLAGALAEYPKLNLVTETAAYRKTLERLGIDPDTADEQTLANATVFYLADYVSQMDQEDLWSHVKDNTLEEWLVSDEVNLGLNGNDATFFSTALRYAAATSFAYSNYASDEIRDIIKNANPQNNGQALDVITQITTANPGAWKYYCKDDSGFNDFNAFSQMLEIFGETNDGSFTTVEGSGYFSNAELQAQLNELLGVTTP